MGSLEYNAATDFFECPTRRLMRLATVRAYGRKNSLQLSLSIMPLAATNGHHQTRASMEKWTLNQLWWWWWWWRALTHTDIEASLVLKRCWNKAENNYTPLEKNIDGLWHARFHKSADCCEPRIIHIRIGNLLFRNTEWMCVAPWNG